MYIGYKIDQFLVASYSGNDSAVFRDLTLNFKKIMEDSLLEIVDRWRNSLADSAYQRAGLRMNSLSKPLNGEDKFEMMAFSVSVVNGCPTCVSSHEKALTDVGVGRDQIHDLARLASVIKGVSALSDL